MRTAKILRIISGLGLLIGLVASLATADTVDKRTFFTFNRPIALPGVTLPAGQYLFRIANPNTEADVVQVLSADGKTPYATLFAIPDERPDASNEPEVRFMETGKDEPSAIKAWWYPGETTGYEFIYPKSQARLLAKGNPTPVLTTHANTTKAAQTHTPQLSRLDATGKETAVAAVKKPAPMPATGERQVGTVASAELLIAETQAPRVAASARRTHLPKTASDLPLVGFMGLLALAGAGGLRLWRTARA